MMSNQSTNNKKRSAPLILDEDQIAARKIPIEHAEINLGNQKTQWHCMYCDKRWVQEKAFMIHLCPKRDKLDKLGKPVGMVAYACYEYWMKAKKRSVPSREVFADSSFFNAFIRFSEYITKVGIKNWKIYIDIAIKYDMTPILWVNNDLYKKYIEHLDLVVSPYDQAVESMTYILDNAEAANLELKDFINSLSNADILSAIRQRRLSYWFVFRCSTLKARIREFDDNEKKILNSIVDLTHVVKQYKENPDVVASIDEIINLAEI